MGTRFEAVFWGIDESFARSVFSEMDEQISQLEKDLSHYDEKSPVTAVNKNAGVKEVPVPQTVIKALKTCRAHFEATHGLFDITMSERREYEPAGSSASNNRSGFTQLEFSEENRTVHVKDRGAQVDFGAIGKGMALELVEDIIDKYEIENILVSFGESSILTRGHHPHGKKWQIGISDIHDDTVHRTSFDMQNHALSTSGHTPRNEGNLRHPKTGRPPSTYQTVSVLASSPVESEVLSTALLLAGQREERRILQNYNPDRAVRIKYDRGGRFVDVHDINHSLLS